MHEIEQEAYLLHSRPYRENQLLLEFITKQQGKVSALSYVGRSAKSIKKGLLQPFSPLKIVLKGKSSLKNLSRVEASQKSFSYSGHYLFSAFYLNELLVRLLGEHIACEYLFNQYKTSLEQLNLQQPLEVILRQFEFVLLDELGVSLDFSPVIETNTSHFYYLAEEGFIPVLNKLSLPRYAREHLLVIAQQTQATAAEFQCYKMLMRQIINQLLDGKPLNSRKLFR